MYRQSGDPEIAFFWVKVQAFCPITVAVVVHFAMVFTGRSKVFKKRWPWVVLYGPPLILSIVSLLTDQIVIGVTKTYWGYTPVPAGSYFQNLIHTPYLTGMSVLSIILSFSYFLRVDDHKEKKRALHVSLGCFVPFFLGFMTQAILPNLNIRTPELTAFGAALQELFLGYAIWKYDLFSLNPVTAANNIVSTMSDLLILARPNGRIVMTNQAVTKALGFREKELIHTQLTTIMSGDVIRSFSEEAEIHDGVQIGARSEGTTGIDHLEATLIARDGTKIPASVAISILKEKDGIQAGYVVIARDVTSQKQAEEALKKSEEKYRTILENIEDAYYEVDIACNFTFFNDSLCKILGYSKDELMGVNNRQHTDKENDKMIYQAFNKVYRTGKPNIGTQYEIIRKDGTRRQVEASASLMKDAEDKPIGFRGIIRDITQRKQAEEELKGYAAELERSNQELEQFAYIASHDLQEPLRMVASYTQLLARRYRGKLDSDADEFIAYAVDGATRMQGLINDLLTYSRIGTKGKDFEPTDCEAVFDRTLDNLQKAVEESGAKISHDPLPTVMADGMQLGQLFQNLIGNAIKFRSEEHPSIHVSCERIEESAIGNGQSAMNKGWIFSVRDNGIGIDPEFTGRIFIIFQRLHKRGEYPGTGIGLAVCKKIVERHGGRIWVESDPGKGSTFYFTIPLRGENSHG